MSLRPPLSLQRAVLPLLVLVAAAAATRAGAQTTLTVDVSGKPAVSANKGDCNRTLVVNWSITLGGAGPCAGTDGDLTLWVTKSATCSTAPASGDVILGNVTGTTWVSQGSGNFSVPVTTLPVFPTSGVVCPPTPAVEQLMRVCGFTKYTIGGATCTDLKASQPPTIFYDSQPPDPPVITGVQPQDSALQITFTVAGTDTSSVEAVYQDLSGAFVKTDPLPASNGSIVLDGLTNGVTYAVALLAVDDAGNESVRSEPQTGTPVQTFGFFASYQDAGGDTDGGCAAAPAGAWPLLALGWVARRRRQVRGGVRA